MIAQADDTNSAELETFVFTRAKTLYELRNKSLELSEESHQRMYLDMVAEVAEKAFLAGRQSVTLPSDETIAALATEQEVLIPVYLLVEPKNITGVVEVAVISGAHMLRDHVRKQIAGDAGGV